MHRVFDPNAFLTRPDHVVGDRGVRRAHHTNDARLVQRIAVADDPKPVQRGPVAQRHAAQDLRGGRQVGRRAGQRQLQPAGIGWEVVHLRVGQQRDAFRDHQHRRRLVGAPVGCIDEIAVLGDGHRLVQRAERTLEGAIAASRPFDDVQDLPLAALQGRGVFTLPNADVGEPADRFGHTIRGHLGDVPLGTATEQNEFAVGRG